MEVDGPATARGGVYRGVEVLSARSVATVVDTASVALRIGVSLVVVGASSSVDSSSKGPLNILLAQVE